MKRMILLAAALLTTVASAQTPSTPAASPPPVQAPSAVPSASTPPAVSADLVRVTITTAQGPIVLALDRTHAPVTVANFLRYVTAKRLDGTGFYRAMRLGEGVGLIQFGTRNDPKRTYPGVAHEPTSRTGLSHTDGAISIARGKPGTGAGDFFMVVGDIRSLDAAPADPGFAVFGHVVEGMDVVRRILAAPVSPTAGTGAMKGQMLQPTIKITSVRRG